MGSKAFYRLCPPGKSQPLQAIDRWAELPQQPELPSVSCVGSERPVSESASPRWRAGVHRISLGVGVAASATGCCAGVGVTSSVSEHRQREETLGRQF